MHPCANRKYDLIPYYDVPKRPVEKLSRRPYCCKCNHLEDTNHDQRPLGKIATAFKNSLQYSQQFKTQRDREFFYLSLRPTIDHWNTLGVYAKCQYKSLMRHFSGSIFSSNQVEYGLNVTSCGHYIHLDCYNQLTASQENVADMFIKGFQCPKCKLQSNIVIPVNYFKDEKLAYDDKDAVAGFIEKCRIRGSLDEYVFERSSPDCLYKFLFLDKRIPPIDPEINRKIGNAKLSYFSHMRTNIDRELILRQQAGNWNDRDSHEQRLDTYRLLFKYLSIASHNMGSRRSFLFMLTDKRYSFPKSNEGSLLSNSPLLWKDTIQLLIQKVLLYESALSKELLYLKIAGETRSIDMLKSIILALSYVKPEFIIKPKIPRKNETHSAYKWARDGFDRLIIKVGFNLQRLVVYDGKNLPNSRFRECWQALKLSTEEGNPRKQLDLVKKLARMACLPYLRAACLLKEIFFGPACDTLYNTANLSHDAVDEKLMNIEACQEEYAELCRYLNATGRIAISRRYEYKRILRPLLRTRALLMIKRLLQDFKNHVYAIDATSLLVCRPLFWLQPSFIKLPENYLTLIRRWRVPTCKRCGEYINNSFICLICGGLGSAGPHCCDDRLLNDSKYHICIRLGYALFHTFYYNRVVYCASDGLYTRGYIYFQRNGSAPPVDNQWNYQTPAYLNQTQYEKIQHEWLSNALYHRTPARHLVPKFHLFET